MDRRRWILAFAIAITCLLIADYYFVHLLFPVKRESIMNELQKKVEKDLLDNPAIPLPSVPLPSTPEELPVPQQQLESDK